MTIDADDTLSDVVETINALGRGVTASLLNDGTGQRLSLTVEKTGLANAVLLDASGTTLVLEEISSARDALVLYGTTSSGSGVLISSSTNEFQNVVDGVNLTVNEGTKEAVTVRVKATNTGLTSAVKEFVDAYNSLRTTLGDADVIRRGSADDRNLVRHAGSAAGRLGLVARCHRPIFRRRRFASLEEVGISLDDKGKMTLDDAKLAAAIAADPASVEKLFTDETLGRAQS